MIATLCLSVVAWGASSPTGRLAYLHDGAVCVGPAAGDAAAISLPFSAGTTQFSLSPRGDGTVVFFAPRQSKTGVEGALATAPMQAFFSRPPYRASRPLPLFLGKDDDASVSWTADGKAEIIIGDLRTRELIPASGRLTVLPEEAAPKALSHRRRAPDGKAARGYTDDQNRVMVDDRADGNIRTLFSPTAPLPLFAAFGRAKNKTQLKELTDAIDPASWKDANNWSVSEPALTPDGKTAFFAANLGTGMGAQGNTTFCLFAADVRTGALAVLSKAGTFFGRIPTDAEVSPDGARLCFSTSVHSSAAENPVGVYVVDLPTQQTRAILHDAPAPTGDTNQIDGWCWSPDGRYLAIAILYYDPRKIDPNGDPDMGKCALYLKDAATGRNVRQIAHAHLPEWSK